MRISTLNIFLLSLGATCMANTLTNGQGIESTEVKLEVSKKPLTSVFKDIEAQTDFMFWISPGIDVKHRVSLAAGRYTVKDALELVLEGTQVKYEQKGNYVLVFAGETTKEKKDVKETSADEALDYKKSYRQENIVRGTVTSAETQEPLAGVNIIVKGTTTGTTTDVEGKFLIEANNGDVLVFTFIGYTTFETQVIGRIEINVALEQDIRSLEEVEINAGYWHVNRKEGTGNIARVSSEDISKQPINNPLQALQGRMSGVFIQQMGGVPGSNFQVLVRGRNSIASGNDPLYVIDGVPFTSEPLTSNSVVEIMPGGYGSSPLSSINPGDIESVEVLKDADATSIYGSRGANGVVLITTKKGKNGKTQFDLSFSTGVSKVANKLDLLKTDEYLTIREEAFVNDEIATLPQYANDVNGKWDRNRFTDWQEELIGGTAQFANVLGTISGGNSNTLFLVSGGYQRQGTVFPGDFNYQRGSTHISVAHTSPNKKFSINFLGSYSTEKNNTLNIDLTSKALNLAPNAPSLLNEKGDLNWENSTWTNPLSELKRKYVAVTNNFIGNAILSYSVIPDLIIKGTIGYNNIQNDDWAGVPSSYYDPAYNATAQYANATFNNSSNRSWIIEPQLAWKKKFAQGSLNVMLGSTFQENTREQLVQRASDFSSDELIEDINAAASVDVLTFNNYIYKYNAVFGRVNMNWNEKYVFNLTGRRDGSSRFGPGKQFANFAAVGMAWIISNEDFFLQNALSFVSFCKLRTSYGTSGNDQIGNYTYLDTYESSGVYNSVNGLGPVRLYNPDFAWEVNKKFEVAIELGFVEDRVFLTTGYYHNRSDNQLVEYPVALTTGFSSIRSNLNAIVQNSGIEMELTTLNLNKKSLSWTTSFNLSFPQNKLVEFPGLKTSTYRNTYEIGKPLSISKRFQYLGVDSQSGIYSFTDFNSDGTISFEDRKYVVNLTQKYFGGINNTFSFKGFQLDVFFQFVAQKGLSQLSASNGPGVGPINQPRIVLERWQGPGDVANVQLLTAGFNSKASAAHFNYQFSDAAIVSTSFVRLKNVSLSYQLPEKLLPQVKSRIYVQGQNILTITKYEGLDPESGPSVLPPLRTVNAGLQLIF